MNITTTRATAALDDRDAINALFDVIPDARAVCAYVTQGPHKTRQAVRFDPRSETLHYFASDGRRAVRLSVEGVPMQRAAGAILTVNDVLGLSAKACGAKLEKLLVLPAVGVAPSDAPIPPPHPEVRETMRMASTVSVPVL